MSVRKLSSGKWNAQFRVTDHPNKSKTFETEEQAIAWLVQQKKLIEDAKPFDSLYEMGDRYCSIGMRGKATQFEVMERLIRLMDQFEALGLPSLIKNIKPEHINRFRIHRLKLVASATCRKDLMLISRIYRWAAKHYMLNLSNPVDDVSLPPDSKPRNRVVERHEVDQLLSKLKPVMAAIVELAYETAMRRSEIVKLTPRDLNLEERFLSVVHGKTGDRVVPLTRRAIAILQTAKDGSPSPMAKLFPVEPHSVSTAFRRARQQVGLDDDVRLHQLRHTRITQVARKGFNQAQIMMVSGHRDSRSVQRYTHLNVKDVLDLID